MNNQAVIKKIRWVRLSGGRRNGKKDGRNGIGKISAKTRRTKTQNITHSRPRMGGNFIEHAEGIQQKEKTHH